MRAFTVYQPYAYAIVAGLKGYETRPRRTNIRGRVASQLDCVQRHNDRRDFHTVFRHDVLLPGSVHPLIEPEIVRHILQR